MFDFVNKLGKGLVGKARPYGGGLKLMAGIVALTAFTALPSLSVAQTVLRDGTTVIGDDRGGGVRARILQIREMRAKGNPVRIEGRICLSSCTMYIGMPETCVSPNTTFGFHGPSLGGRPMDPVDFENTSRIIASFYPEPIRTWYMNEGRTVIDGVFRMSGAEVIRHGVRQC